MIPIEAGQRNMVVLRSPSLTQRVGGASRLATSLWLPARVGREGESAQAKSQSALGDDVANHPPMHIGQSKVSPCDFVGQLQVVETQQVQHGRM